MKKILLLAVILAAAWYWQGAGDPGAGPAGQPGQQQASAGHDTIAAAFENRQSGIQVTGAGNVVRILADDNDGGRHQRFLIELDSGQTLLIAHNIDLAPRIGTLREGDSVSFNGVYEWNDRGGVIHWTHHDPQGQHTPGWLRHNGRTYE
jgi:hypothetical protein